MKPMWSPIAVALVLLFAQGPLLGQTFPSDDPVIERMWAEGMDSSRAQRLAQVLLDSLGPRLTGSPAQRAAQDWLLATYASWGIEARNEQYGTWKGWERGVTHIDLVEPRVRTLQGMLLAWSPATDGTVRAGVVLFPEVEDSAAFEAWLPKARDKFVLLSFPEPSCRPEENWEEFATRESLQEHMSAREAARRVRRSRRTSTLGMAGRGPRTTGPVRSRSWRRCASSERPTRSRSGRSWQGIGTARSRV